MKAAPWKSLLTAGLVTCAFWSMGWYIFAPVDAAGAAVRDAPSRTSVVR